MKPIYLIITRYLTILLILVNLIQCNSKKGQNNQKTESKSSPTITKEAEVIVEAEVISSDTENESDTKKNSEKKIDDNKKNDPIVKPTQVPLTITITNLESSSAPVTLSFYGPNNKFPDKEDQLKTFVLSPKNSKSLKAKLSGLEFGELAIAAYQDVNKNGHIDQDMLGIPKEPYGFSNDVKPKLKAPSFEDCKFVYNAKSNTISISMFR